MVWAKTPVALGSVLCAACLAVATTTPAAERAADQLATTVERGVNLKVDLSILDAFSALPTFQALLAATTPEELVAALGDYGLTDAVPAFVALAQGDVTGFDDLDSLSAINPLVSFITTGNTAALADLDSVSAVPAYQALAGGDLSALGDLESTNAIPAYLALATGNPAGLNALQSTNGIQSFADFAASGDVSAFDQVEGGQNGYAALSGLSSYRDAAAGDVTALTGIDAFSGLQAYLPAPPPEATTANATLAGPAVDPAPTARSFAPQVITPTTPTITTPTEPDPTEDTTGTGGTTTTTLAATTPTEGTATGTPGGTTKLGNKSGNGSYSAKFSPVGLPVLFGSGKGKGAADNGMRGYGAVANGLRAAVGLGPDTSGQGAP
ncbi:hypothetical protein [Mycobacterium sp. URHB0021]